MSVKFNVAELAGVVAKTLSSIGVRTASVLVDGKWQNVMTVIRLLCESTVDASADVDRTKQSGWCQAPRNQISSFSNFREPWRWS